MTTDQTLLFGLLFFTFVFLIWGRWRYDLVAFVALIAALLLGVVTTKEAFSGFGHPVTIIIALVLIISKGLSNSGAIELIAKQMQYRHGVTLLGVFRQGKQFRERVRRLEIQEGGVLLLQHPVHF